MLRSLHFREIVMDIVLRFLILYFDDVAHCLILHGDGKCFKGLALGDCDFSL